MDKLLLPRYVFADITVYMKVGKGEYLNLTDFAISEKENERVFLNSDSRYAIMFCSFFYLAHKNDTKPYICDISLNELLELSGIHDKTFLRRFDTNEECLAVLCAKKIMDYRYGKAVRGSGNIYRFYRRGYYSENGKYKKRSKVLIFEKRFYEA